MEQREGWNGWIPGHETIDRTLTRIIVYKDTGELEIRESQIMNSIVPPTQLTLT